MSERWDLEVYNKLNQLVLAVEVKSKLDAPVEWASEFRRNMLSHGILPNAPFFMMVCPDKFFLWKDIPVTPEPVEPTHIIDAVPIIQSYIKSSEYSLEEIDHSSLELLLSSWVHILTFKKQEHLEPYEQWTVECGLFDAVSGGVFVQEALVCTYM